MTDTENQQNSAAQTMPEEPATTPTENKTPALIIWGFVTAFLLPLVGLILSIIGLSKAKKENTAGKGLAKAGIIVSITVMIISTIIGIIMGAAIVKAITNYANTNSQTTSQTAPLTPGESETAVEVPEYINVQYCTTLNSVLNVSADTTPEQFKSLLDNLVSVTPAESPVAAHATAMVTALESGDPAAWDTAVTAAEPALIDDATSCLNIEDYESIN